MPSLISSLVSSIVTASSVTANINPAGENRVLIVITHATSAFGASAISACTFKGASLTFLRASGTGNSRSEVWYMVAPSTGSGTIEVTQASGFGTRRVGFSAYALADSTQDAPAVESHAGASNTAASMAITVGENTLVIAGSTVGATASFGDTLPTTGFTSQYNTTASSHRQRGVSKESTGGTETPFQNASSSAYEWAGVVIGVQGVLDIDHSLNDEVSIVEDVTVSNLNLGGVSIILPLEVAEDIAIFAHSNQEPVDPIVLEENIQMYVSNIAHFYAQSEVSISEEVTMTSDTSVIATETLTLVEDIQVTVNPILFNTFDEILCQDEQTTAVVSLVSVLDTLGILDEDESQSGIDLYPAEVISVSEEESLYVPVDIVMIENISVDIFFGVTAAFFLYVEVQEDVELNSSTEADSTIGLSVFSEAGVGDIPEGLLIIPVNVSDLVIISESLENEGLRPSPQVWKYKPSTAPPGGRKNRISMEFGGSSIINKL